MSSRFFDLGGLAHVFSLPGGSKTEFAVSCLNSVLSPLPPSEKKGDTLSEGYFLFASDEGFFYPLPLYHHPLGKQFLSRLLIVKISEAKDVWKVGLEATQTGLFRFVFLRPSQTCQVPFLRKLQLAAERTQSRVLLLSQQEIPHWLLQASFVSPRPPSSAAMVNA